MKTVAKLVVCAVAYMLGVSLTWTLVGALHLPAPHPIPGVTTGGLLFGMSLGTLLLAAGLVPLAVGLGGSRPRRSGALFVVILVAVGLNTMIEATVFSTFVTVGIAWMTAQYVLPSLLLATALAVLFSKNEKQSEPPRFSAAQWAWRLVVAWVAFPAIYWVFGMCVAPFVLFAYRAGIAGLTVPPVPVILRTVFIRSALFLVSSLPIIALWSGSRRSLFIAFGVAESMMVGIFGLVQASWFPMTLRVAHSIEITLDSFAYIGVLVLLFAARKQSGTANADAANLRENVVA
ncbi:MAG: hypothetical protein ROO76_02170 [Terriglobia bacterium]|nr:hypothetical protein [Terriglobia bacterium]